MIFNIVLMAIGAIFCSYDIFLLCINPGNFLETVFSFTHVWSLMGGYLIFLGIYRNKKGHSFWSTWKKGLKLTVVSLFYSALFFGIVNLVFITNPKTVELTEECDYVIVLGGGINKYGKLPKNVQIRVKKAAEYLNLHPETPCVVSGGVCHFSKISEAPELKRVLAGYGVNDEFIFAEGQAKDTIQNFEYSCDLLCTEYGLTREQLLNSRIVVITSNFHLRRAERLAARMGFTDVKGIGAKIPWYSVPHMYLREICSYIKLNLRIIFTHKPKSLLS